jgi:hypothetical protein
MSEEFAPSEEIVNPNPSVGPNPSDAPAEPPAEAKVFGYNVAQQGSVFVPQPNPASPLAAG